MNLRYQMLAIASFFFLFAQSASGASHKVYIFLSETCPLSQYYTLTLKELHTKYASEELEFVGVFPNRLSTAETIEAFKDKYSLPFNCIRDSNQDYVAQLNATVTPEAIVTNATNEIIYRGRIDNAFARVGKRRRVVTHHELTDVLNALSQNQTPDIAKTQAIGCLITRLKPTQE